MSPTWVSAGKESYVPDIFEMIMKPGLDMADARNWPAMGTKSLSGYQKKRLFHNEGGQIFKDEAARHGLDSERDGRGIAVADFDNDGRLDGPDGECQRRAAGWAAKFGDFDNDSWPDLFVVNGLGSAGKEIYIPRT